mmetsp:Transcript_26725/g.44824  ORF Transcript_26725/g.44824 Transcript_26725/m.44824 type:complete len:266 (+) Transcript_26725:1103-1900(+)
MPRSVKYLAQRSRSSSESKSALFSRSTGSLFGQSSRQYCSTSSQRYINGSRESTTCTTKWLRSSTLHNCRHTSRFFSKGVTWWPCSSTVASARRQTRNVSRSLWDSCSGSILEFQAGRLGHRMASLCAIIASAASFAATIESGNFSCRLSTIMVAFRRSAAKLCSARSAISRNSVRSLLSMTESMLGPVSPASVVCFVFNIVSFPSTPGPSTRRFCTMLTSLFPGLFASFPDPPPCLFRWTPISRGYIWGNRARCVPSDNSTLKC